MSASANAVAALRAGVAASAAASRYSDGELELIYGLAYRSYQQGDFAQAARYFSYLTLYRPTDERFLKGLGGSQFMGRLFSQALGSYAFLVLLDPQDAEALCMHGYSLLMLGERQQARAALARAAGLGGGLAPFARKAAALLLLTERQAEPGDAPPG
ncbi:tetratricopeptide repeat protein [Rugamonas aquatica]|uniref:Tetratricopeptide repeat protein n=1 Tax=Rugamonas aquatica TaxID=2743357 RepID=A0A6A7N6L9_9BURK|nr:tetratricopeptide repeat protein [Rugamonas aquatica]MQA40733.1 tetratricopeptide repeat protein [Rugamonas aquatica]